jgi:hypothetical protein
MPTSWMPECWGTWPLGISLSTRVGSSWDRAAPAASGEMPAGGKLLDLVTAEDVLELIGGNGQVLNGADSG